MWDPAKHLSSTITHRGVTADAHEVKASMLMGISFPPPTPYDGDEVQEGPEGTTFHVVDKHLVARAFRGTARRRVLAQTVSDRWRSRACTSGTLTA